MSERSVAELSRDVEARLRQNDLEIVRDHDSLLIRRPWSPQTRIDFVPASGPTSIDTPINVVVQIRTELPRSISELLSSPAAFAEVNRTAALGAVTVENGRAFVGSRLTMYEAEGTEAEEMQVLMVAVAGFQGAVAVLGAAQRWEANCSPSEWTESDFHTAQSAMIHFCVCNSGDDGLTAEFGLVPGAISVGEGDIETALWQLHSNQPHPVLGGGLLGILQLPYPFEDAEAIGGAAARLNQREMEPQDGPPHFGAWCITRDQQRLAYVTFLPNVLHRIPLEVTISIWAKLRAQRARAKLLSLGLIDPTAFE